MKTKFVCEKCNKCFETENECIEHEKICCLKESLPIKGIFIGTDNDENFEIYIMEYPTATLFEKNKIKLVGESYHFIPFEISKLNLEEIYEYNYASLGIFTTNFSKEHEEECIDKLIKRNKEIFKDYLEASIKNAKEKLEKLKNTEYKIDEIKIERKKDCHQVISDFEDYIEN